MNSTFCPSYKSLVNDQIINKKDSLLSEFKNSRRTAKKILYETFYAHLMSFALVRHELTSRCIKDTTYFDKRLVSLESKNYLLENYRNNLAEVNLKAFAFLFNLSKDKDFGLQFLKYAKIRYSFGNLCFDE